MKTYEIISLENGKVLQTIEATGFTTDEQGIVLFYEQEQAFTTRVNIATTQVSSGTLIVEKKAPKPALVVELKEVPKWHDDEWIDTASLKEEQCTKQS